jgi:hypothetical protein
MKSELEVRNELIELADAIIDEAENLNPEKPTKAGMKKLRKLTLEIAKIGKEYRKSSINKENGGEK